MPFLGSQDPVMYYQENSVITPWVSHRLLRPCVKEGIDSHRQTLRTFRLYEANTIGGFPRMKTEGIGITKYYGTVWHLGFYMDPPLKGRARMVRKMCGIIHDAVVSLF